jgi:hypothetical protein
MKPEDVERQKVLESYGYRFLRLNRFNLGTDPVRTLDGRLARMARDALQATRPHPLVDQVKEQTNGSRTQTRESLMPAAQSFPISLGASSSPVCCLE